MVMTQKEEMLNTCQGSLAIGAVDWERPPDQLASKQRSLSVAFNERLYLGLGLQQREKYSTPASYKTKNTIQSPTLIYKLKDNDQ